MTYLNCLCIDLYNIFLQHLRKYERSWLNDTQPAPVPELIEYGELHLFVLPLVNTYIARPHDAISAVKSGSCSMLKYLCNQFNYTFTFTIISLRCVGKTGYTYLLPALNDDIKYKDEYIREGFNPWGLANTSLTSTNRIIEVILGELYITQWTIDLVQMHFSTLKILRKYLGPYRGLPVSLKGPEDYIRYVYLDQTGLLATPTVECYDYIIENSSPQLVQATRDKFHF